jgi:hypothetical protein
MPSSELLNQIVERGYARLAALSDEQAAQAPAPGNWSPKQIVGHLIDSACNNHSRFVRAQLSDELDFPGYRQEQWVVVQRYDVAPWAELLSLWRSYNRHIAWIVGAMPGAELRKARPRDTLDPNAWGAVLAHDPITLEHFVIDYMQHLEHHLSQIMADYEPLSFERPYDANGQELP